MVVDVLAVAIIPLYILSSLLSLIFGDNGSKLLIEHEKRQYPRYVYFTPEEAKKLRRPR